jgi:hypothetical protein
MNDQNYGEKLDNSAVVDRNDPAVNSDLFADKHPVDAALLQETPMGGTVVAVDPVNEPVDDEVGMFETPVQEIPMGGTVAPVGPLVETETAAYAAPAAVVVAPYKAQAVETAADTAPDGKTIPNLAPSTAETISTAAPAPAPTGTAIGAMAALLNREESEHFRTRWNEIQGKFVDEPRTAVQQADALVSEVSAQITQMFASEHTALEAQWNQGNDVSTEDLRKALQRYRSFFNRLVV